MHNAFTDKLYLHLPSSIQMKKKISVGSFLGRKAMATPYMHRAEIRWLTFSVAILKLRLPNFAHM